MTQIFKSAAGALAVGKRYAEILDGWPVPSQRLSIPTRAGNTFVLASGAASAPPLIALHGSGAHAGTWIGDISSWATKFRVYAVDMLGEPGKSAAVRLDLGSDATTAWLDDVLDGLSIERAAFVGMSLGGWVVLDYTIRRPRRVTRAALLCPGGIGRQTMGWLPRALLLRAFGRRGLRRTAQLVTGLDQPGTERILDDVALTFSHFLPRTERLPIFSDDELRGISVPTQVLVGDQDVMMDSAETARRVRDCIPDAEVIILTDTGHAVVGQTNTVMRFLVGR